MFGDAMRWILLSSVALLSVLSGGGARAADSDIVVTATKRVQALADVPLAVSAVSATALTRSGAHDIRQLNQLVPSLLVSSSSSESTGGVARIRGVGTVGDNPGLESSVGIFVDGVYRPRSGAGLTELGAVDRIEVLRGPQGTLFGRNAAAGLLNIVTVAPSFESTANAEFSFGNYGARRLAVGMSGPLARDRLAYRLDGVLQTRAGFIKDLNDDRRYNNRDRWLLRGQLLFTPSSDLSVRIIGDYAKRQEECCASTYMPFHTARPDGAGGADIIPGNPVVDILRGLGGTISDDTWGRQTALTPGRSFRSDVRDWGLSAQADWNMGFARLTSITAWRDWRLLGGQDADFESLDILYRNNQNSRFRTFSEELRLNGKALDGRLDWLLGAYYAHERLDTRDDMRFGNDAMRFGSCLVANSLAAAAAGAGHAGLLDTGAPGCVNAGVAAAIAGDPALPASLRTPVALWGGQTIAGRYGYAAAAAAAGQPGATLAGHGIVDDRYRQNSRHFAIFTHNVIDLVPGRVQLTLGGRYTNERKTLAVDLHSDNLLCAALAGDPALSAFAGMPCLISPLTTSGETRRQERQWTGTAILSWKPAPEAMLYASYALGYKAGGFNLDRTSLDWANPDLEALKFEPEKVRSAEIGAKLDFGFARLNVAAFRSIYAQFQLNAYNGTSFTVENITGCRDSLGGADSDASALTGACAPDRLRGGVKSTGIELDGQLQPTPSLSLSAGFIYADTRYRHDLAGAGGRPLPVPLANLPGNPLSNAPKVVHTAALAWTPRLNGYLGALVYADYRLQSGINTGSDLFPEKWQDSVFVVNARLGLNGNASAWQVELWAQNLFNANYRQVTFNAPLLGSGSIAQTISRGTPASTVFGSFLAEPRLYGVTIRTRF